MIVGCPVVSFSNSVKTLYLRSYQGRIIAVPLACSKRLIVLRASSILCPAFGNFRRLEAFESILQMDSKFRSWNMSKSHPRNVLVRLCNQSSGKAVEEEQSMIRGEWET